MKTSLVILSPSDINSVPIYAAKFTVKYTLQLHRLSEARITYDICDGWQVPMRCPYGRSIIPY